MNPDDTDSGRLGNDSYNNTRRQFVAGSAGALGGLAVGSALGGTAFAQEGEENGDDNGDDEDNGDDSEEMPDEEFEDDVDVLNYALTLEYLEAEFYRQGLENISEEEFCNCRALKEEGHLRERIIEELQTIRQHEETHAETLASVIQDLGGEPIEEPEFDFGLRVQYPMVFLATAVQLEDLGVSAYAGAAPYIENEDILAPALSIHSVEARHASFVRTLSDQTGFPDAFDEARSREEVLDMASAFIVEDDDDDDDDNGDDNGDENGDDGNGDGGDNGGDDNGDDGDNGDDVDNGDDGDNGDDVDNGDNGDDGNGNGDDGNGNDSNDNGSE